MSYYMLQTSGLGAAPHGEWYAGLGAPRGGWYAGLGATGVSFDPGAVWSDWVAGSAPTNDYARGTSAAKVLQAALAQLGYGDASGAPLIIDGKWGAKSGQALMKFSSQYSVTTNCTTVSGTKYCYPTKDAIAAISTVIQQGGAKGPDPAQTVTQIAPGIFTTVGGGSAKAGMLAVGGIALAAAVAGLLFAVGKKKPEHHAAASHAV